MQEVIDEKQLKCIPFLAMLYVALALANIILTNKLIQTPFAIVSASVFVSMLWFMLGDVIAEVYGYKMIMTIFWSTMICQLIAGVICHYLVGLSSPATWHGQAIYDYVLGHFLSNTIASVIALLVAWRLNAYLLTKWKIKFQGKYFILRSIVATSIGSLIYTIILSPLLIRFPTIHSVYQAVHLFLWICVFRVLFTFILAFIGNIGVMILKKIEKIDIYETANNFRLFRVIG